MLLDFHLAHEPLRPDGPPVDWLGGTPGYMSPEQQAALIAVRDGKSVPVAIDGRSDLYSLGLLIHELLGGTIPLPEGGMPLPRRNPQVSVSLADIIARCLRPARGIAIRMPRRWRVTCPSPGGPTAPRRPQPKPGRRLAEMAQPPAACPVAVGHALVVLGGLVAAGFGVWFHGTATIHEAERALADSREQIDHQGYDAAARTLARGLNVAEALPIHGELVASLRAELDQRCSGHRRLETCTCWPTASASSPTAIRSRRLSSERWRNAAALSGKCQAPLPSISRRRPTPRPGRTSKATWSTWPSYGPTCGCAARTIRKRPGARPCKPWRRPRNCAGQVPRWILEPPAIRRRPG